MTKSDIINEVAKQTGLEKVTVARVVEGFMTTVKGFLGKGKNVYLRGFGSFVIKKRAKKTARNISKNTTMVIPA
ncbi:MAG: integration host factor subunit beta, partial [Bacteroidales bacterium]|nr:integration host factor subunit beta [Bacteroidales bacterium]